MQSETSLGFFLTHLRGSGSRQYLGRLGWCFLEIQRELLSFYATKLVQ